MLFLGCDFYFDESAAHHMVASSKNMTNVEVNNAIIDEVYATSDVMYDMSAIPTEWDFNTALHALFNGSLTAGNVDYLISEIISITLKRRELGTYEWLVLAEFPVDDISDLNITFTDRFANTNKVYEYMLMATTKDNESTFNIGTIESRFDGIVIAEKDIAYRALIYDYVSTERNQVTSVVTTLKGKYPYVIKNAETNYTSGQVHAAFIPMIGCEFNFNYFDNSAFREELSDFLTNGRPKILKLDDGRSWIVSIIDNIRHSEQGALYTDFNFVQTGDALDADDMYNADLIDVSF